MRKNKKTKSTIFNSDILGLSQQSSPLFSTLVHFILSTDYLFYCPTNYYLH